LQAVAFAGVVTQKTVGVLRLQAGIILAAGAGVLEALAGRALDVAGVAQRGRGVGGLRFIGYIYSILK